MPGDDDRYAGLRAAFGEELLQRIRTARVLVVGAGGIGCELLKDLVLSGFEDIETLDLDTIDVSNLNRQFLFRPQHVGQSKAMVARAAVTAFNPASTVKAHHGNVKNVSFGINYVKRFDLVFNALDNIGARRHVNRLCLATDTPLIESGTTGYLGQVQPIRKGVSACYECTPKPTPKVFPICSIRSTPSKYVHLVVWAKEFYKLLFGKRDDSMLFEADASGSTYMDLVGAAPAADWGAPQVADWGARLLAALYDAEIRQKIEMDVYKGAEKPPAPLSPQTFSAAREALAAERAAHPSAEGGTAWTRRLWSEGECARELLACLCDAYGDAERAANFGALSFDKDDALSMRFVAAAANLRGLAFGIEGQSYHDAKGVAGNIIPAIATTNAVVAGLQVLEAIKILRGDDFQQCCRFTWVQRHPTRKGQYLQPTRLEAPNPKCLACSGSHVSVHIDVRSTTLRRLCDAVLRAKLGIVEPNVMMGDNVLYEEGEDADEALAANLDRTLADLPGGGCSAEHGGSMMVDDFMQDFSVKLNIFHRDHWDEEKFPEGFYIGDEPPPAEEGAAGSAEPSDDDDRKRKREGGDVEAELPPESKRK